MSVKKLIKLINSERVDRGVVSRKADECIGLSSDFCRLEDHATCTVNSYDVCGKDYAGCYNYSYDYCENVDNFACGNQSYDLT